MNNALGKFTELLASKLHISALTLLGIYIIVLPLAGIHVPIKWELVGGNYTNVTSDIAACIAASLTVKVHSQHKSLHAKIASLENALRKHPTAPVHVGETPENSPPVG